MGAVRKITTNLPADLVERAQAATGKNLTETLKEGLELVARDRAYARLRSLKGKLKLDVDLEGSRRDRT